MFFGSSSVFLVLLFPFLETVQLPTPSPETTNAYLRSFLPWWPQNDDFMLRTAPSPPEPSESTTNDTEIDNAENLLTTPSGLEESDISDLRVHDVPASPLDELSPDNSPRSLVPTGSSIHEGNFIINFEEMGECPKDCSNDLREALGLVLQDMSHVDRYHRICEKYQNASTCVIEDERCDKDDRGMFQMMTSGLHYMCVEQQLAFNATIKCIDDEAGLVQSECDAQCQTKNLFMNWMMKTAMQDTIQQGVSGIVGVATGANPNALTETGWADMLANIKQRPPNPQAAQQGFENFRQFTNDLCRIGDCMLDCIRSKFNTRCEGSAGTLLSEVFVRPIAVSQNKLSILRPVLGVFMPEQCAYLTNNQDLKKHRIDATMDEELKRMYAEKMAKEVRDKVAEDELLSNLVPLDENGVPLPRSLPELKSIESPLDVSVKTLDQLILDMYSKNESEALNISEKNNVTATFLDTEDGNDETHILKTTPSSQESEILTNTTMAILENSEEISKTSENKNKTENSEASGDYDSSSKDTSEGALNSHDGSSGDSEESQFSLETEGSSSGNLEEASGDSSEFTSSSGENEESSGSESSNDGSGISEAFEMIENRETGDFETSGFNSGESASGEQEGSGDDRESSREASGDLDSTQLDIESSGFDVQTLTQVNNSEVY